MAVFDGLLPAPGAQTVAMRLREMSMQVCASDPRTMPQRRADALVALADGSGQLRCQCGRGARCPKYGVPIERPRRPLIQIGIPADTLLGIQESPAFLAGYGPIDAALARILAEHARIQVIPEQSDIDDPTTAEEAAQWRPTPRLEREVRAVDGMCRFPGCAMPAAESELDHNHPFDHERPSRGGPTARTNLAVLCGRHHRLKTLADKENSPGRSGARTWSACSGPHRRATSIRPSARAPNTSSRAPTPAHSPPRTSASTDPSRRWTRPEPFPTAPPPKRWCTP